MQNGTLLPVEIENKEFSASLRGYNPSEVRAFLHEVAERLAELGKENRELQRSLASVNEQRSRLEGQENIVKDTLLLAQRAAEDAKIAARQEADAIIREAEAHRVKIIAEVERLRSEKAAFIIQFRSFLDGMYERMGPPGEAVANLNVG